MNLPSFASNLDLDPDTLAAREKFFALYAEAEGTLASPDHLDVTRLRRLYPLEANDLVPFPEPDDPDRPPPPRDAEVATAWCQAASSALLTGSEEASNYLRRAAERYMALDLPFGWYLHAVCEPTSGRIEQALEYLHDEFPVGSLDHGDWSPVEHPVQQILLLLTIHVDRGLVARHGDFLRDACNEIRSQNGASRGPSGRLIADWCQFILDLDQAADHGELPDELIARLDGHLRAIATAHGAILRAMYEDTYHWKRGHFRSDVVDLTVFGIACMLSRWQHVQIEDVLVSVEEGLDLFDSVSFRLGRAFAADTGGLVGPAV